MLWADAMGIRFLTAMATIFISKLCAAIETVFFLHRSEVLTINLTNKYIGYLFANSAYLKKEAVSKENRHFENRANSVHPLIE